MQRREDTIGAQGEALPRNVLVRTLFAFAFFPRVSILFTIAYQLSFGGWVAWLFLPSALIAYHAYVVYGDSNPALVTLACLWVVLKVLGFVFKLFALLFE